MKIIEFVPGAVVSPGAITIPTTAPDMAQVVAAQIHRVPSAIGAHTAAAGGPEACAGCAVDPHVVAGGGGAASVALAANLFTDSGAGGNVAHVVGAQPTITHANIVAGIAAHAGTNPVVAAVPTLITTRTLSLDVNTVLGDLLMLSYREVGERILAS